MPDNEIFDPLFLDRLRLLYFKLRKRRQLQKRGAQATPSSGFTREFKDHRQYSPGDDFRLIDWRMFARLEKMFIRIFEEVQEVHVHILIDRSRSMVEPFADKRVAALQLAVGLAYLALLAQHRVSIHSLGGDLRRETKPLKGQGHVHVLLKQMAELEFSGETDLVGSLRQFRPSRDRRGIVFVISDLFGRSPALSLESLLETARWPAETHVVQVLHPKERQPDLEGEIRLVDVETDEVLRVWLTRRELARYREEFDQFLENIRTFCMAREIDYFPWSTDQSFEDAFLTLLSRGQALAGA